MVRFLSAIIVMAMALIMAALVMASIASVADAAVDPGVNPEHIGMAGDEPIPPMPPNSPSTPSTEPTCKRTRTDCRGSL